jgi:hypothetical protein
MSRVCSFAALVPQQIHDAESWRAFDLRPLRCHRNFTDELTLRPLDWLDWCMLTHAKKKNLVMTRAVILARIKAARQ